MASNKTYSSMTVELNEHERKPLSHGPPKPARPSIDQVREVQAHEYREAAVTLAEAFQNDTTSRYPLYTKDMEGYSDEYKQQLHLSIMEYLVFAHCIKGHVTTIGPNYGAVLLSCHPGKNIDDWLTIFRSGLWRLWFKLSAEGCKRFFSEFLPLLHDTKTDVLGKRSDDSYYLVFLGTRADEQRKGYSKTLLDHVAAKADLEGRACYLESSDPKNVSMYQHRGYEIKRHIYLSRAEIPIKIDIMVREPRRPATDLIDESTTKL